MVQAPPQLKRCSCGSNVEKPKRGPSATRCPDCRRLHEKQRQHQQYKKRRSSQNEDLDHKIRQLQNDIDRSQKAISRYYEWRKHHVRVHMALSSSDRQQAKQLLQRLEDQGGFFGEPLHYPAVCSICKKRFKLPFLPQPEQDVYCPSCLAKKAMKGLLKKAAS